MQDVTIEQLLEARVLVREKAARLRLAAERIDGMLIGLIVAKKLLLKP